MTHAHACLCTHAHARAHTNAQVRASCETSAVTVWMNGSAHYAQSTLLTTFSKMTAKSEHYIFDRSVENEALDWIQARARAPAHKERQPGRCGAVLLCTHAHTHTHTHAHTQARTHARTHARTQVAGSSSGQRRQAAAARQAVLTATSNMNLLQPWAFPQSQGPYRQQQRPPQPQQRKLKQQHPKCTGEGGWLAHHGTSIRWACLITQMFLGMGIAGCTSHSEVLVIVSTRKLLDWD